MRESRVARFGDVVKAPANEAHTAPLRREHLPRPLPCLMIADVLETDSVCEILGAHALSASRRMTSARTSQ